MRNGKREGDSRYVFIDRNRFDEFEKGQKKDKSKKEKKKIEEVRSSIGNGDYSPWQGKDL